MPRHPGGAEGPLIVDRQGRPLAIPPGAAQFWSKREASLGPLWPSGPDIDGMVIVNLVRRFGRHGSKIWGSTDDEGQSTPSRHPDSNPKRNGL